MNKKKSKNKLIVILSIVISVTFYFTSRNPEYIKIMDNKILSKNKFTITEIDINRFAGETFNSRRRHNFLKCKDGIQLFPTTDPELISKIVHCIGTAEENYELPYPENVLFFKTGNPIIGYKYYYLPIDWDGDRVYGKKWQSEELCQLFIKWKTEK